MEKMTRNAAAKKAGLWICTIIFAMIFLCAGRTDKVFAASAAGSSDKNAKVLTLNSLVNGDTSAGETVWFSYTPQRNRIFYLSGYVHNLESVTIYENTKVVLSLQEEWHGWNYGNYKEEGGHITYSSTFGVYCALDAGKTYYYELAFKKSGTGKYYLDLTDPAGVGDPCGPNLTWSVDKKGVLTISGTGEMFDYAWCEQGSAQFDAHFQRMPPWLGQNITAIKLGSGVTSIGEYAFQYCEKVTSLQIPTGVKMIGKYAFMELTGLTSITLSDTVTDIGKCAFLYSPRLKKITIPASVKNIGWAAVGFIPIKSENAIGSEPDPDFVISGYSGSGAEKYANEYKIKFIALDKPQVPTPTPIPEVKLSTPKLGKIAGVGFDRLKFTWNGVKGADGYCLYMKNGTGWKVIADVKGNVTAYTHKGLTCGKTYTYTVRAYKNTAPKRTYSGYSKTGITGKTALSMPQTTAVKAYAKYIKTTWKPVPGASGYLIYRKTGSGQWVKIAAVKDGAAGEYNDRNVKNGTKYTYTVRAYRSVSGKNVYSGYNKTGKTVKK